MSLHYKRGQGKRLLTAGDPHTTGCSAENSILCTSVPDMVEEKNAKQCREQLRLEINHMFGAKARPTLRTQRTQNTSCKQEVTAQRRQDAQARQLLGRKVEIDIIFLSV